MRIAYIGNYYNYGYSVSNIGTILVYLLVNVSGSNTVDVFCPNRNNSSKKDFVIANVNIHPVYDSNKPFSILNLYKIEWKNYDLIIFNSLPTSFGRSSFTNFIGITLPLAISKLMNRSVKLIYHNSTYTNDVFKLGYNSNLDKIRFVILRGIEQILFKNIDTYFPVNLYVEKIRKAVNKSMVRYLDIRYFEGLSSILVNRLIKNKSVYRNKLNPKLKTILLHGYWGPQKNLEFSLSALASLWEKGYRFKLILSGGLNRNFLSYSRYFHELVNKYSYLINERIDYIGDDEIFPLFMKTDLVLIPYNAPGGHSSVLETAITFENNVVCVKFAEFEEQAFNFERVKLVNIVEMEKAIEDYLKSSQVSGKEILIYSKVIYALNSVKTMLLQ